MELHGKQIIGQSMLAESQVCFQATNPVTGGTLPGEFHHAAASEIERAASLADDAFQILGTKTVEQKADFLEKMAEEMMSLGDDLIQRGHQETGLPEARLQGERGRTCNQLKMFASLIREGSWVDARIETAIPHRKPVPKPDMRLTRVPLGPVLVFCASNFPLAFSVAGGDTASALAAGNPVIVKAHHAHPGTAELVGGAIQKAAAAANMPEGVFSLLHGPGREVGIALVKHPSVKAVGFTGSQKGGRTLFDTAASRPDPIPVYAEMSSINPMFILHGALKERAEQIAAGLCQSVTLGVGQFCTCPGIIVVLGGPEADSFLTTAAKLLAESTRETMLTSGIFSAYAEGLDRFHKKDHVDLLGHEKITLGREGNKAVPAMFRTDGKSFLADNDLSEELFGPTTLAVVCSDEEEMRNVARKFRGELTATIYGNNQDGDTYHALLSIMAARVGRLLGNKFPTGVEVCSAMNHGGPYPATTDVHCTSVGTAAILRFSRPICYQDIPDDCLPDELQNANPRKIWRLINGEMTRDAVEG